MVRRPVAWVVAIVLFAEAFGFAALNWFLGEVVDRQQMSLAGLDADVMSTSSKAGGVVFGLYFALCGLVALLVALRGRRPAGFGRVLLISVAVVHALLGAFAWGLVGPPAFLFMVVVLALVVLLLMTYDREEGDRPAGAAPDAGGPGGTDGSGDGSKGTDGPGTPEPSDSVPDAPAGPPPVTPPAEPRTT
ncbi:hypothetical protein [Streptomyces sp. NPDC004065]|uniref:hypothetical protein n=1 Tax=Streptomyces sp. NPDC004065 TaxID=3364689 RepID=UPI00384CE873